MLPAPPARTLSFKGCCFFKRRLTKQATAHYLEASTPLPTERLGLRPQEARRRLLSLHQQRPQGGALGPTTPPQPGAHNPGCTSSSRMCRPRGPIGPPRPGRARWGQGHRRVSLTLPGLASGACSQGSNPWLFLGSASRAGGREGGPHSCPSAETWLNVYSTWRL